MYYILLPIKGNLHFITTSPCINWVFLPSQIYILATKQNNARAAKMQSLRFLTPISWELCCSSWSVQPGISKLHLTPARLQLILMTCRPSSAQHEDYYKILHTPRFPVWQLRSMENSSAWNWNGLINKIWRMCYFKTGGGEKKKYKLVITLFLFLKPSHRVTQDRWEVLSPSHELIYLFNTSYRLFLTAEGSKRHPLEKLHWESLPHSTGGTDLPQRSLTRDFWFVISYFSPLPFL